MNSRSPVLPSSETDLIGHTLESRWRIEAFRDEVSSGVIRIPTLRFDARDSDGQKGRIVILDLRGVVVRCIPAPLRTRARRSAGSII
jgi:hypothetical protein